MTLRFAVDRRNPEFHVCGGGPHCKGNLVKPMFPTGTN